jgi:hypothetical protein
MLMEMGRIMDSIQGPSDAKIMLSVYESGYFMILILLPVFKKLKILYKKIQILIMLLVVV